MNINQNNNTNFDPSIEVDRLGDNKNKAKKQTKPIKLK